MNSIQRLEQHTKQVAELEFRTLELSREVEADDGIPAVISTDARVRVGDVDEILQHTAGAIDLSRAPLPLIESHDKSKLPLGVVDSLRIVGGKLRARVRFGNTDRARQLLKDVKAGVLRSLSVGYQIVRWHMEGNVRVVTEWAPFEVSAVAAPADVGAGFFRARHEMLDEIEERDRCAGIVQTARMFEGEATALDAIRGGESLSSYRTKVVMQHATRPAFLGMSQTELRRYSLARALLSMTERPGDRERGFEQEIHEELSKRHRGGFGVPLTGDPDGGFQLLIPPDVAAHALKRDLTAGNASGGGYLVGTSNAPSWVELLAARSVGLALGVQTMDGLRDNITISREVAGDTTTTWHSTETTQAAEQSPVLGQIAMTPKTVSAYAEFSRQLMKQSSPQVDLFIARRFIRLLAAAIDAALVNGSGVSGQPLGLIGTPGIGSVSGSSLALAGVLEFQTDIGEALGPSCGYVTTRATAATLAARQKFTGSSTALWEGNLYDGTLGGWRSMTSSSAPAAHLIFGAWDSILLGAWGTLAIEVNPFANFAAGIFGVRALHSVDTAVLRPDAFSVATAVS